MTDGYSELSNSLIDQENRLVEVQKTHLSRMRENGTLQKAQKAYIAERAAIPSGGGRASIDTSEVLRDEQFTVSHSQIDGTENIMIVQDMYYPVLVGKITNMGSDEPKAEANQKNGFNVVDMRSVASMVKELVDLKSSGELANLTDDLQRIEEKPIKPSEPSPNVVKPLAETDTTQLVSSDINLDEAIKLLAYSDVLPEQYQADALDAIKKGEATINYAEELRNLYKLHGGQSVQKLARDMVEFCAEVLKKKDITPTIYAPSISWALWDIAKQSYLAKNPDKSSTEYNDSLEDPLALTSKGDQKRIEIRERHVGWEVMRRADQGEVRTADLPVEAQEIIKSGQRNETGQLRSYELAKLGHIVSESV